MANRHSIFAQAVGNGLQVGWVCGIKLKCDRSGGVVLIILSVTITFITISKITITKD